MITLLNLMMNLKGPGLGREETMTSGNLEVNTFLYYYAGIAPQYVHDSLD